MRPSKIFLLPLLLVAASIISKADTFTIFGAYPEETFFFSIPSPSTPDFLSGNSFAFNNVSVSFFDNPFVTSPVVATVSFADLGDDQYFSVLPMPFVYPSGHYPLEQPSFFTIDNGQVSFIPGNYGFIGIGESFFMSVQPDPQVSAIPEPSAIALIGTGALCLAGVIRRKRPAC